MSLGVSTNCTLGHHSACILGQDVCDCECHNIEPPTAPPTECPVCGGKLARVIDDTHVVLVMCIVQGCEYLEEGTYEEKADIAVGIGQYWQNFGGPAHRQA